MPTKKANKKGKRYTADEKAAIVEFVRQHNAANGRGGATAAAKQFGASQLSIGSWLKAVPGEAKAGRGRPSGKGGTSAGRGRVLAELGSLDHTISIKRKELAALESRFEKLKASL